MTTQYEVEEEIAPGLKYTEETGRIVRSLPVRDCFLWRENVDEPISGLNILYFRQRFGAVSVSAAGIGGVATLPPFRRQGHMSQLMTRALAGIRQQVAVVFLADAIETAYETFGFVNCLAEAHLSVPVHYVEQITADNAHDFSSKIRDFTQDDLPAMSHLYNQAHAYRPWTHERGAGWNRLHVKESWRRGSEAVVLEDNEGLAGYAIFKEQTFGVPASALVVDELTARDMNAAQALLVEMASRCWQMRLSHFDLYEPLDSAVGKVAASAGCGYHQEFLPSGGMMGAILDRQQLLAELEPELRRRLGNENLYAAHEAAFVALDSGELLPDNRVLLRLLLGFWSLPDALTMGTVIPDHFKPVCQTWFPGGGSHLLPLPHAHKLDRY